MNNNNYINQQIGNYRVISELSSGSFGRVYLAQHTLLTNRIVAIKVLHTTHLAFPEEREHFLQEARFLEQLKHPYILPILDVGIVEGFPYLVAEYAANGSLRNRIRRAVPHLLPLHDVLTILRQVGQALQYAHQQQIIHRDMKPENILFNSKNEAVLADFGLATSLSTASIKHVDSSGTPAYMAPEQFQGNVSKESDQYSLACIAYELVTGQQPFRSETFYSIGYKHLTEAPTPPSQLNPSLPATVEQVILKAMAKQRGDRYHDVSGFISALLQATDSQTHELASAQIPTLGALKEEYTPTVAKFKISTDIDSGSGRITEKASSSRVEPIIPEATIATWSTDPAGKPLGSRVPHTLSPQGSPALPASTSALTMNRQYPPAGSGTNETQFIEPSQPHLRSIESMELSGPSNEPGGEPETARSVNAALPPASSWPISQTSPATKRHSSPKWLIPAIVLPLVGISIVALILLLVSPLLTSHTTGNTSGPSLQAKTTISSSTTPGSKKSSKPSTHTGKPGGQPTPTSIGQSTSAPVGQPTQGSTQPSRQGTQPTSQPSSTAQPGPSPTIGPSPATPSPTSTTPPAVSDTLTVDFANPYGTQTTNSYTGMVTVTVSGAGGVGPKGWSDAFYQYVDFNNGNPINPPEHSTCYVMYINGAPTDGLVSTPAYNTNHLYQFTMNAPGGRLNFSICDHQYGDNHGSLTVKVTQN